MLLGKMRDRVETGLKLVPLALILWQIMSCPQNFNNEEGVNFSHLTIILIGCNCNAGNYPEWDEDHPIHFVGHSAGAQVVRLLQQMLANKVSWNCIM